MAAAQPSASTFAWKQATVFPALLVPLHNLSMLLEAHVVPPPQDTFPDCRMLLHCATSSAEPPVESVAAGTGAGTGAAGAGGGTAAVDATDGATLLELHSQPNAAAVPLTLKVPLPVVSVIASVAPAGTVSVAEPELQVTLEGPETVQAIREL
jgi:hypothetical protein